MGRKRRTPSFPAMSMEENEQLNYERVMMTDNVSMSPMVSSSLLSYSIEDGDPFAVPALSSVPNNFEEQNRAKDEGVTSKEEGSRCERQRLSPTNTEIASIEFGSEKPNTVEPGANINSVYKCSEIHSCSSGSSGDYSSKEEPIHVSMNLRWIDDPTQPLTKAEENTCKGVLKVESYIPELERSPLVASDVQRRGLLEEDGKVDSTTMELLAELLTWRTVCPNKQSNMQPSFVFSPFFLPSIFDGWMKSIEGRNQGDGRKSKKNRKSMLAFQKDRVIGGEFERVGLNLEELDILFFPLLVASAHWGLVVVHLKGKRIEYYDPLKCMGNAKFILAHVCLWLMEWNKSNEAFSPEENFRRWKKKFVHHAYPTQKDAYSCGVYVLSVIEYLQRGQLPTFIQKDIPNLRKRLWYYIVQTGHVKERASV